METAAAEHRHSPPARESSTERLSPLIGRSGSAAYLDKVENPTPQLVPPPTHAVAGTIGEKHGA